MVMNSLSKQQLEFPRKRVGSQVYENTEKLKELLTLMVMLGAVLSR